MSTANRIVKNTFWLYAKMGVTMFISLYTTRLILNSLGASDFGIYNIVGGTIAMLGFLNVAMATATQRFMSYAEGEGNKNRQKYIFNVSVILHFIIAILMSIVLGVAGIFLFDGILNIPIERGFAAKVVYVSLLVSTLFTVMNVPYDAVMNAHENMKYYAIVGIVESLLKLVVALFCVHTRNDKLVVYGILMAIIPLIILTIMKVYCHYKYEECVLNPRKYWDKDIMRDMASFAGWNLAGSMGGLIGNYGCGLVINVFFGAIINAAVGIAVQLNGMLLVFSNNMLKALNPVIVKNEGSGAHQKVLEYSYSGCKFSFLLFAVFCLPCIIEAPYVLKLWIKEYPEWTILFVRYQLFRTILEQITVTLGTAINAVGKIKGLNIYLLVSNILPVMILYVLFHFGASPNWFYPVIIICMVGISSFMKIYYCWKYCQMSVSYFVHTVIMPCLVGSFLILLSGYVVSHLMHEGFLRFMLTTFVMFLTFLPVSYWILSEEERCVIIGLFQKIKQKIIHI